MKYDVKLTEKNVGFLTVEVQSPEAVEEAAMEQYLCGETRWEGTYLDFAVQPTEAGAEYAGE